MTPDDRLRHAFRAALGLPGDAEVDDLAYRGITQWDSLAHMTLIAQLEDDFDVLLDTDEVVNLSSFAKAREILERHGVSFDA